MKQQHKFSLGYYLVVFFSILMLESIFFSGAAVKEISYSRFGNCSRADRIQSVIVESDRIFGLEKTKTSGMANRQCRQRIPGVPASPTRRRPGIWTSTCSQRQARQKAERQFVVTRLDDPS
jgi:hypothetical protein